jgi:hypothetical protein
MAIMAITTSNSIRVNARRTEVRPAFAILDPCTSGEEMMFFMRKDSKS